MVDVSRVVDEAEEQLSLDLYNETWPHDRVGIAEVRSYKQSLVDHVDLIARVDGEPAGSAVASLQHQRADRAFLLLTVLPSLRRRGAGSRLYEAASDWARERGHGTIEVPLLDDDPESVAFAERRGFTEERREKGVALDLTRIEPPPVEPPPGIEVVTWAERPELVRGIYEVASEAYPDVPGSDEEEMLSFEDWLARDMQGSGDRPEATFVAVCGDEVVGYSKFSLTSAQPVTAHHDMTGVKRAWRSRGVARALKATQIAWAKANGYEELRTRNDERNAPIRKLNADFGYEPCVGRIYMVGPIAGS